MEDRRPFDKLSSVTPPTAPATGTLDKDVLADQLGLADTIVDEGALARSVARFREQGITCLLYTSDAADE